MTNDTNHKTAALEINDAHCHFFSEGFFAKLWSELSTAQKHRPEGDTPKSLLKQLGWDAPGSINELADRWVAELDHVGVNRVALMSSVPEDELSVAKAIERHPKRFVGMFMVNPLEPNGAERVQRAFGEYHLRCACLFPAMHHYSLNDESVKDIFKLAAQYNCAVFVHCGILSIGVRKKLKLRSVFDIQCGNPLALIPVASQFPTVPIIVPHFGAGFFKELLMASDLCQNIYTDTSSSNSWTKYMANFSLVDVFHDALNVLGPERILFGTDSSFFPRGWQQPLFDAQQTVFDTLDLIPENRNAILSQNFNRVFGIDS